MVRGAAGYEVVFEPRHLLRLMASNSVLVENYYHLTIEVAGQQEVAALLEAALADPVDFLFIPSPETLAVYADHDGYTTLYAPDASALRSLESNLQMTGFQAVFLLPKWRMKSAYLREPVINNDPAWNSKLRVAQGRTANAFCCCDDIYVGIRFLNARPECSGAGPRAWRDFPDAHA